MWCNRTEIGLECAWNNLEIIGGKKHEWNWACPSNVGLGEQGALAFTSNGVANGATRLESQ